MTEGSKLYNKGLLIMDTMRRHNLSKEKATEIIESFLKKVDEAIPDVEKVIDDVLIAQL